MVEWKQKLILREKEAMPENTQSVRDNHFSDAELVCELLTLEVEMSNQWERCYPYYDETSHFWAEYVLAQERYKVVESLAMGEHI